MSARSQLHRSFEKYRTTYITILEETERTGELEALKKRTFIPLKVIYCYWDETTNKDYNQAGESQDYQAKIRILYSDILDIQEKLNQYCRVLQKIALNPGEWEEREEWTIETILPRIGPGGFRVLEMQIKLPKEGNQVRL
jgi:hypothetical protein